MMKMMLNNILRREISRQTPVIPLCLRFTASSFSSTSSSTVSPESTEHSSPSVSSPQNEPSNTAEATDKTTKKVKSLPIEENPYYSKYSEKIKRAQQLQQSDKSVQTQKSLELNGLQSPSQTEEGVITKGIEKLEENLSSTSSSEGKKKEAISRRKSLNDVVHLEKLHQLSQEEISTLWKDHHERKENVIYAVIPSKEYDRIFNLATQYPLFLLPLPKTTLPSPSSPESPGSSGYELYLTRFRDHSFFLTPLAHFQSQGESATPFLVINHYPELSSSKGVVLMNGDFDPHLLNLIEVQCLANEIKMFYSGQDVRKTLLLHTFNREPENFDYREVIKAIEDPIVV